MRLRLLTNEEKIENIQAVLSRYDELICDKASRFSVDTIKEDLANLFKLREDD